MRDAHAPCRRQRSASKYSGAPARILREPLRNTRRGERGSTPASPVLTAERNELWPRALGLERSTRTMSKRNTAAHARPSASSPRGLPWSVAAVGLLAALVGVAAFEHVRAPGRFDAREARVFPSLVGSVFGLLIHARD